MDPTLISGFPPGVLPDEDMLSSTFQRSVSEQTQKDVIAVIRWLAISAGTLWALVFNTVVHTDDPAYSIRRRT
jgi:hypothetical protein